MVFTGVLAGQSPGKEPTSGLNSEAVEFRAASESFACLRTFRRARIGLANTSFVAGDRLRHDTPRRANSDG